MYIYNGYSVVNKIQNRISKDIWNGVCAVDVVEGGWGAQDCSSRKAMPWRAPLWHFANVFVICLILVSGGWPPPPTCQWLCVRSLPSGDEKHPLCHHRRHFLAVSESLQQIANTAPATRWKEKSYDLHPKNNPGHQNVNISWAAPVQKSQCLFLLPSKERNEL